MARQEEAATAIKHQRYQDVLAAVDRGIAFIRGLPDGEARLRRIPLKVNISESCNCALSYAMSQGYGDATRTLQLDNKTAEHYGFYSSTRDYTLLNEAWRKRIAELNK